MEDQDWAAALERRAMEYEEDRLRDEEWAAGVAGDE